MRWPILFATTILVIGAAWISHAPPPPSPRSLPGWALYDRYCLPCHGEAGDGRGPAAPFTRSRPRDLARGEHAWRSTPLGAPPTDDDLRLVIRHGAPGTSMPAFPLADAQVDQLVDVVKAFAPKVFAQPGTPIALGAPPPPDRARGARLWSERGCVACHGADGRGDTPAARALPSPPYDLAAEPLHRPHAGDVRRAAALAIATGRGAMPGYAGSLPDAELWALADHVVALGATARPAPAMTTRAIELDRTAKITTGTWPAPGDEAVVFGAPLAPQGIAPPQLAPAQASLSSRQCARCHAKQVREWQPSLHAGAVSPGLAAQMMGMKPAAAKACLVCHAPLAEQREDRDPDLRAEGLTCAGCHVRGWTRHGPPNVAASLLGSPSYPLVTLAVYERADFCLPCHQLPPRTAVEGRPLLDTYREWLEGPYMPRGIQCQHCHMPNREHSFKGIHDPDTFRQGIALAARATSAGGAVTVIAELANVGAGHYLPTTPTPAAWLAIQLLDAQRAEIPGATASLRIGRDISFDDRWHEHADTRIPPGGSRTLARAWTGDAAARAVTARITVVVHPDDYYERLYERRLAGTLEPARRTLYEQALARARSARYTATQRDVAIVR